MFRNLFKTSTTARRLALIAAPLAVLAAAVPSASAADRDHDRDRDHDYRGRRSRPSLVIHAQLPGIIIGRPAERVVVAAPVRVDEVPASLQMSAYQSKDRVIVIISGVNRGSGYSTTLSAAGDSLVLRNIAPDACREDATAFTITGSICSQRELREVCVRIGRQSFEIPVTCVASLD